MYVYDERRNKRSPSPYTGVSGLPCRLVAGVDNYTAAAAAAHQLGRWHDGTVS